MKKIRCTECGNIIAMEIEPIDSGEISIMCPHKKPNGKRCKTVNVVKGFENKAMDQFFERLGV